MALSSPSRPVSLYLLLAGVVCQGLSGLLGGAALLWDPSGNVLGMSRSMLVGSPFADYRIPGLLLFVVLGVGPLIVSVGLWTRRPWAWYGALAVGGALAIWIGVQILMIGYTPRPPLQLIYAALALLLLALPFVPPVRRTIRAG